MQSSLSLNLPAPQSELSILGATVRAELTVIGRAIAETLTHAFAVGEALNQAKKLAGHGNWEAWLGAECGLSPRTARAYMQLANHRGVLEQKRQRAADLSIRAALRLIGTGATMRKRFPASALKVASWKAAAPEERAAFVNDIPLIEWLAVMPASWRSDIVDRIDGLRASLAKSVIPESAMRRAA
jgi:hypothetical protein